MAVLGGPFQGAKRPASKGYYYVREWRGMLVVAKWPAKRKRPLPQHTQEQNEWFKQANKLAQYIPATIQAEVRRAVEGTPLLPRDLLIAAMAGRLYAITDPEVGTYYSRAMANDVSQNLDIIGQALGDMLVRGSDQWTRIPRGEPGWLLFSRGQTDVPEWRAGQASVRLLKSTTQLIVGGAETLVTWQFARFDDDGFFNAGDPNKITVPAGVSRMTFTAGLRSNTITTDEFAVQILEVGGDRWAGSQSLTDGAGMLTTTTGPINVTEGQEFEVRAFSDQDRVLQNVERTFFSGIVERA